MKARVKATGEIVNVYNWGDPTFRADNGEIYQRSGLDFDVEDENNPDYWTRLEHQAAIAAMQGILSNQDYCKLLIDENNKGSFAEDVSRCASEFSHALVHKLKEKEERK